MTRTRPCSLPVLRRARSLPRSRAASPVMGAALAAAAFAAACSPADSARDANKPAVIALAPPPAPPAAPLDTTDATHQAIDAARRATGGAYVVAAAASMGGDQRMLGTIYAPDAVLQTPDSSYRGVAGVAAELIALARRTGMADFVRTSLVTVILKDSTVGDSGTYVITSKREGAAPKVVQRGRYGATWKVRPEGEDWLLVSDRLHPEGGGAAKPAAGRGAKP